MKWVVIASFIVCLATLSKGSALRSTPESKDAASLKYNAERVRHVRGTRGEECLAGSQWESNCHKCTCTENGRAECHRMETCKRTHEVKKLSDGVECLPRSSWKSKCNSCFCSEDGHPACTDMACPGQEDEPEVTCAPDTTWKIECNTCTCSPEGYAMCTKMGCGLFIVSDFNPINDQNEQDKSEQVLRSSSSNKSVVCAANRMFVKDCNTCWCNEDGTSYFCTRKVCIAELPDDVNEEKPENLQEIKRKCRPDEVFELDCNTCRCSQDGTSFSCTRKACVPEEKGKNVSLNRRIRASSQGTPKACQPGQEFRMDCNKCLCNNEGQDYSCTRIDCAALNSNGNAGVRTKREVTTQVKSECEPGSVFNQGCNPCRCTDDGNHATCALKRCNENANENDKNLPESDPSFRCNPGEQYKRDCNDCTCSADGKSIFCTLRFCDQDLTPTI
ncbi:protein draper-like isoform X2 [Nymphalis io]|uniref:protein draper-like isoform X2 n=1 Tax=Inachis io TaxID=171585 RepID=UPI00216A22BC|nr:protein draper-like isoform X2 [Nymphalis io]